MDSIIPARDYAKGIGSAVADRTINRLVQDTTTGGERRETWEEVAHRVAVGNTLLHIDDAAREYTALNNHLRRASVLMSGRHLQHGDETQPTRPGEVMTNCASSASSFVEFYLLLNGSGVGRCYDDDMMLVDYSYLPIVVPVIDQTHKDVQSGEILFGDERSARHFYADRQIETFRVPDSREGWAKAIERMEVMAFQGVHRNTVLLIDFSDVRPRGTPIKGMQNRPASGPCALMVAIANVAKLRDAGMEPWRAAMYADHYFAECVLVGGARRAARMAAKSWRDPSVKGFIKVKQGGFLWSSNNSVLVDKEFWMLVNMTDQEANKWSNLDKMLLRRHAKEVFELVTKAAYFDKTGEPGFINQDMLKQDDTGFEALLDGDFAGNERYQLDDDTRELMGSLAKVVRRKPLKMIVNPCGEIPLSVLGGYCTIADVVPYHATPMRVFPSKAQYNAAWDENAEDAFRTATRALIRTNLMDFLYDKEVKRTNRIGVGFTGLHEYAWARFGYGFRDLIDEEKSRPFWLMMARFSRAVQDEARAYSAKLGVAMPHTVTTCKPAGTTSKLFSLTEGAHLPSMREYLRWVQFRNDDPLIEEYRAKGYPVRTLKTYSGTTIVGFPTQPEICTLGMGEKLVTAAEATPEEQYRWLMLLEKYYIRGTDERGEPLPENFGGQVSYTLKIDPEKVSYEGFRQAMLDWQSRVKCCSVMPQVNDLAYEYTPEEAVNKHEYEQIVSAIEAAAKEDVAFEHVDCGSGACPISWDENK